MEPIFKIYIFIAKKQIWKKSCEEKLLIIILINAKRRDQCDPGQFKWIKQSITTAPTPCRRILIVILHQWLPDHD
jgi:hypothetical protein